MRKQGFYCHKLYNALHIFVGERFRNEFFFLTMCLEGKRIETFQLHFIFFVVTERRGVKKKEEVKKKTL